MPGSAAARRSRIAKPGADSLGQRAVQVALAACFTSPILSRADTDRSRCAPRIARIGGGEALRNGVAGAERVERGGEVALAGADVADLVVRYGEVALRLSVAGIGGGEALAEGEAGAERGERGGEVALASADVADLVVRYGEVALAAGALGRRLRGAVSIERFRGRSGSRGEIARSIHLQT